MSEKYLNCLALAAQKHDGQKRMTGESYITHPVAVAGILEERGYHEYYVLTALLHDVLEDAPETSMSEIWDACKSDGICKAVELLTKKKGCDMNLYLGNIKFNALAYHVKCADRYHNLTTAFKTPRSFREKYTKETRDYYLDFSKNSAWEWEILSTLERLEQTLK